MSIQPGLWVTSYSVSPPSSLKKKKNPYVTLKHNIFSLKLILQSLQKLKKSLSIFLMYVPNTLKGCPCTGSLILLVLARGVQT